jgi:hypothetical protein
VFIPLTYCQMAYCLALNRLRLFSLRHAAFLYWNATGTIRYTVSLAQY